jgi:hypothetical protein
LILSLSVRCPSKIMNITMWQHCTFDRQIFWLAKFSTLNYIIMWTLIPSC